MKIAPDEQCNTDVPLRVSAHLGVGLPRQTEFECIDGGAKLGEERVRNRVVHKQQLERGAPGTMTENKESKTSK